MIVPSVREVELSDLELGNTTRLILYYEPSQSLRIMSGQDVQPQKIPNIASAEWLFAGIEISPNQKWFIYKVSKGMKDGVAYFDYWINSVDGNKKKIAVSNVHGGTEARWVSDEQIEIWFYPDGSRACPERLSIVNPFTEEVSKSSEIPHSISPQCFFDLSTSRDHSKMVYLNEDGFWSIFDFATAKNQTVFPWLSKSERFALWPRYIHWSTSGMTLVLPGQESVDFIIDLPISDVSKNNVVLNKILFPDGTKIYNETFSWWELESGFVGFDLVDADYDYSGIDQGSPSSNFAVLDLKNSIWYDYNLDRAKTGERQKVISSFIFSSADNRFLAWTIYEPPDMSYASETVVLDRKTGRIARIQGFEFFGWGEIDQP
jgi:hypothetical protein